MKQQISRLLSAALIANLTAISAEAGNYNQLVDDEATGETRILYTNLKNLSTSHAQLGKNKRTLFGHHNTTLEGDNVNLTNGTGSDVKDVTGYFPAVYGFDFNRIDATNPSLDDLKIHIANAKQRNGIITFSWHAKNPATGGTYGDETGDPVTKILLKSGNAYNQYISRLDRIAEFAKDVGTPIIFRPLHEGNGKWFWWGTDVSSSAQYISLWKLTVEYLRDAKGVRNFLYAYSPSLNNNDTRYPGDDYVDIIGGDMYNTGNFSAELKSAVKGIVSQAHSKHKVAALTEVGPRGGLSNSGALQTFYKDVLLNLKNDSTARRLAYVMTWRNGSPNHYWVPTIPKGSTTAAKNDFQAYFNDASTVFENQLFDLYQSNSTAISGFPYCVDSATVDPDGDGWGWESRSCVMVGGQADPSTGIARASYYYCNATKSIGDPDGDGWGYQNSKSCVVPGSPADLSANW